MKCAECQDESRMKRSCVCEWLRILFFIPKMCNMLDDVKCNEDMCSIYLLVVVCVGVCVDVCVCVCMCVCVCVCGLRASAMDVSGVLVRVRALLARK